MADRTTLLSDAIIKTSTINSTVVKWLRYMYNTCTTCTTRYNDCNIDICFYICTNADLSIRYDVNRKVKLTLSNQISPIYLKARDISVLHLKARNISVLHLKARNISVLPFF